MKRKAKMIKIKSVIVAAVMLLIAGNAFLPTPAESSEKLIISEDAQIKIIEKGLSEKDKSNEICASFNLTVMEARQFFKKAEIIPFSKIQDSYHWLPCYVRGTYTKEGKVSEWDINAGGFATVKSSETTTYLGCDDCEGLFPSNEK